MVCAISLAEGNQSGEDLDGVFSELNREKPSKSRT